MVIGTVNAGPITIGKAGQSLSVYSRNIAISGGTQAAGTPLLDVAGTWNSGATVFTGHKLNITDTSSSISSLLMDLQVGGSSKFYVTKGGGVVASGGVQGSSLTSTGNSISVGSTTILRPTFFEYSNSTVAALYNIVLGNQNVAFNSFSGTNATNDATYSSVGGMAAGEYEWSFHCTMRVTSVAGTLSEQNGFNVRLNYGSSGSAPSSSRDSVAFFRFTSATQMMTAGDKVMVAATGICSVLGTSEYFAIGLTAQNYSGGAAPNGEFSAVLSDVKFKMRALRG
jgi:uncharacterized protein YaiE (UPF0345 family)